MGTRPSDDKTHAPSGAGKLPDAIPSHPEEFVFLNNEALDSLVTTVLELSAQLWTVKRRAMVTEKLLESKGVATSAEIETFVASQEDEAEWKLDRDQFIKQVYGAFARNIPLEQRPRPGPFTK